MKISPCRPNCVYHSMFVPFLPVLPNLIAWKGISYNIANEALIGACFFPSGLGTNCKENFHYRYLNASRCLTSSISRWGTNHRTNIRLHSDQVAEEARWCMVSRGPIEGLLDSFCNFSPHPIACVRCNKPICWRQVGPYRMSHMPFL